MAPKDTPQQRGRDFEEEFSKRTGAKQQPGSGNQHFALMDNEHVGKILWSLKYTDFDSFRLTKDDLKEVQNAVNGPGGVGGDTLPAMAININGLEVTIFIGDSYLKLLEEDVKFIKPDKTTERVFRASIPSIMRDNQE